MANVAKYTRAQTGAITRHFERAKKDNGEYQQFKNQEIDITRSHLNYNLAPERGGGQLEFIRQRTSEVRCLKRENINVMCSWVITMPKDFAGVVEVNSSGKHIYDDGDPDIHKFFSEAYKFLNNRYAKGSDRNVISAYVHMDETTPHLHYAFVPVVWDAKRGIEKVSAKAAIHRLDLQTFHPDLEKHMTEVFSREIGILNDATKNGNKSIEELKRGTAQERIESLENENEHLAAYRQHLNFKTQDKKEELQKIEGLVSEKTHELGLLSQETKAREKALNNKENELKKLEVEISHLRAIYDDFKSSHIKPLENKKEALEMQIRGIKGHINSIEQNLSHLTAINAEYEAKKKYIAEAKKSSDISMMYPSYAELSTRGLGKNKKDYVTVPKEKWEQKHISANDVDYLKKMQSSLEKSMNDFANSQSGASFKAMTDKIDELEKENTSLRGNIKNLEATIDTKTKESKSIMDKVNRVLSSIDKNEADKFIGAWHEDTRQQDKGRNRDWGHER